MYTVWVDSIKHKYLLVINIPHFRTRDNQTHVDDLWHKDLQLHRQYIQNLELASPLRTADPPLNAKILDDAPNLGKLSHVDLPDPTSLLQVIWTLPTVLLRLWKAINRADIVHVNVGGWPYPLGWPTALMARLQGKFMVVVIESAPWRLGFEAGADWRSWFRAHIYEKLARWIVNKADGSLYTQAEYRASLLHSGRPGIVTNATWIDEDVILSDPDSDQSWLEKQDQPVRLIFAGRVFAWKGIDNLLEATRLLAKEGLAFHLDVMGEGDRLDACRELAAELTGPTTVGIVPPVSYGLPFFETLRRYHAVVVPSLGDEQPRIVYDAFSQAVPVIASDTAGIRDCTSNGQNAVLVPTGDVAALAQAIREVVTNPSTLQSLGKDGLAFARRRTHAEMHRVRHRAFLEWIEEGTRQGRFPGSSRLNPRGGGRDTDVAPRFAAE